MLISFLQRLYEDLPIPDSPEFFNQLAEEIELFSISAQVYSLLFAKNRLSEMPESLFKRLKDKYNRIQLQNLLIKQETESLLSQFRSQHIMAIPLKGTRFAERFFGHFAARGTSDIDLLIYPEDIKRAIDNVKALGFTEMKEERRSNNHCSFYKQTGSETFQLSVELHWGLEKEYGADVNHERIWQDAISTAGDPYIKELSNEHTFYYICLHGARHQMESVKYFIDILQILHQVGHELDFTRMFKQAARDKTLNRMKYVLTVVYRQFPHLHNIKPLLEQTQFAPWNYEVTKATATQKKNLHYYMHQILLRFYMSIWIYDGWKHRILSIPIVSLLIPPVNYIIYSMDLDSSEHLSNSRLYRLFYQNRWKKIKQLFGIRRLNEGD